MALKFNTQKVLQDAQAERDRPKPLPKIKAVSILQTITKPSIVISADATQAIESLTAASAGITNLELSVAEREYADIRQERNKLSTTISFRVEEGASPQDLKDLYEKIEAFRDPIRQAYDRIKHIKQFGSVPSVVPASQPGSPVHEYSIFELRDQKRKLVDRRCKLAAKLKPSAKPSKPEQIAEWTLELEQANAQYADVEAKIKKLEGQA